ncbi:MAG: holo-ACP synthase [Streptococcaceae bacterium]|jgi:holo-[acyl-carrier protein] synthase|nr:holo-ACP synthase [Streptococcaceae bacterium]
MIKGIGTDIVDITRILYVIKKKPTFAQRVLTEVEYNYYKTYSGRRQAEFLAGRFAAKEAFSKAWGTGIGKLSFHDIEISKNDLGAPFFSKSPYQKTAHLSISHTDNTAIAFVVLEE